MPDDKPPRPSFWSSMPGLLAGSASLITAIVAALTFLDRGKPSPPAAVTVSPQTSADLAPKMAGPVEAVSTATPSSAVSDLPVDDPDRDVASCQRIAGNWVWSTGGFVNIGEDGSLQWRARATDPGPTVVGRWVCTHPEKRQYQFSWSHGFTDVFVLSADGRRVSGTNQQTNTPLFGNRQN